MFLRIPKSYNKYGPYCYAIKGKTRPLGKEPAVSTKNPAWAVNVWNDTTSPRNILGFARGAHVDFENTRYTA
jgi:hypothetical protein